MTVRLDDTVIRLEGACHLEDADALTILLQTGEARPVDLSACEALHAAVVQALLALKPSLTGLPPSPFLRDLLLPALAVERQARPSNL
ncbi:hypothetical protein [Falsiroseomonas tokyonensis]|uniref:STAS domain-containing protein n=1 Tax=Falsiroseomonas tokyonensis TaxID=430521 RepID=A0ABV7C2V0_9PROT|nr:hypothetical protein [Falsiroseomonas tokyonensis]MBU8540624.1 hypothetical protein [Falsiroseomonas tokyonensis]